MRARNVSTSRRKQNVLALLTSFKKDVEEKSIDALWLSLLKTGWLKDFCDGEWIDLQAYKINPEPWIMKQATSKEPHSIEIPETCYDCLMWGFELDEKGLCESCKEDEDE